MKHLLFSLLFMPLYACSLKTSPYSDMKNLDLITWSEGVKLQYSDFKAKVKPLEAQITNATTSCASGIHIMPQINLRYVWDTKINTVNVISYFDRNQSWFDVNHREIDILEHEQVHFNIIELVARRLRMYLSQRHKPISINLLKLEYEKSREILTDMQNLYDRETEHGTLKKKQTEWQKKIKAELDNFQEFENEIVKIKRDVSSLK